jgi:hypothetical protein
MARYRISSKLRVDPELAQYMNQRDWELVERKLDAIHDWVRERIVQRSKEQGVGQ